MPVNQFSSSDRYQERIDEEAEKRGMTSYCKKILEEW